jgi:hypothetical protein
VNEGRRSLDSIRSVSNPDQQGPLVLPPTCRGLAVGSADIARGIKKFMKWGKPPNREGVTQGAYCFYCVKFFCATSRDVGNLRNQSPSRCTSARPCWDLQGVAGSRAPEGHKHPFDPIPPSRAVTHRMRQCHRVCFGSAVGSVTIVTYKKGLNERTHDLHMKGVDISIKRMIVLGRRMNLDWGKIQASANVRGQPLLRAHMFCISQLLTYVSMHVCVCENGLVDMIAHTFVRKCCVFVCACRFMFCCVCVPVFTRVCAFTHVCQHL